MGEGERRSVGVVLGAGIFLAPWLFVWLLLRRGHSTLSRGLGFGWFAVIALGTFSSIRHRHDTSRATSAASVATIAPPSGSRTYDLDSGPRLSQWTYESSKDDMRGSTDSYATLESVNGLGFGFPYNRGKSWGRIRLQKTVRSGVSALLTITQGQFVCAAEGCSVPVKFDEGPIEALWCSGTADGDPTALFVGDPRRFISRLKRAHSLIVEPQFFQEGSRQLEFMSAGLVWKD